MQRTGTAVSRTLVFAQDDQSLIGFNFLKGTVFECEPELVSWLGSANLEENLESADEETALLLRELGALHVCGSWSQELEKRFLSDWQWGIPAALFHFSLHGRRYLTSEESTQKQLGKAAEVPSPPLFLRNQHCREEIELRPSANSSALLRTIASRRTRRECNDAPLEVDHLGEILYAGLGITGFTRNLVAELPLSMTPSGGARNPYEAYVIAADVEGVARGVYHYSALDHSLGLLEAPFPNSLARITGGQDWVERFPCLIVLCAFMERTMWKYDDPNAYRVVLIEAGHIAQNMMLAGTQHGYAVNPTAALAHDELFDLLQLENPITQCAVYALAVGKPRS
jgi:SagB-type dehydrogenase family enzyme